MVGGKRINVVPVRAMKAWDGGSADIIPLILNLDSIWI
jgi:hypothetical protein